MKSAVVTGASGFVGSALVRALRMEGVRVLAVSRTIKTPSCDPGISHIALDSADILKLPAQTAEKWDAFFHLAWSGTAGNARADVEVQLKNVRTAASAVLAAQKLGCTRFIGAGSIMEREIMASSADPSLRPGSSHIYAAAKLAAHQISRFMAADAGIAHLWAVITNAYGPGESSPRLLNTTLRKILRGEDLLFTAARQNYDFIHVDDAARALVLIGRRGKPFAEYTVGSGMARPLFAYLEELCAALCPEKMPVFGAVAYQGASLPAEAFDIGPLRRDTGFTPQIPFARGVCQTMDWIRKSTTCACEK